MGGTDRWFDDFEVGETFLSAGVTVTEVQEDETAAGQFTPIALKLSFMPSEWAKVSEFVSVRYSGRLYHRGKSEPVAGLFEVASHDVHVRTRESG